jgi:hypothetical protein
MGKNKCVTEEWMNVEIGTHNERLIVPIHAQSFNIVYYHNILCSILLWSKISSFGIRDVIFVMYEWHQMW